MPTFTKTAIKATFISLLNKKPLNKITVKEIVEECGINRNSFYYHFDDIPSLLEEILVEEADRFVATETDNNTSVYESLKQIMQLADFVKFAKMNPLPDENDLSLMNAYLFINQTKEEEIPVPGEGEKAEGEVKSVEKNDSNISKE